MDERWSSARSTRAAQGGSVGTARRLLPAALALGVLAVAPGMAQGAPADRVYERISPASRVLHATAEFLGAGADDTVAFTIKGAIGDPNSFAALSTIQSRRSATGWDARVISPVLTVRPEVGVDKEMRLITVSEDGRTALAWTGRPLVARDRDEVHDLYRIDVETGAATLISARESGDDANNSLRVALVGASPDLSRIVFVQANALVPDAPAGGGVYQWENGTLTLLSRLPNGTASNPAWASSTATLRSSTDNNTGSFVVPDGGSHAVSDDGRVVFWGQAASHNATTRLYASIAGSPSVAYTTSQRTIAGGIPAGTIGTGRFIGATHDGGTVFFASSSQLTDAATTGGGLYRYTLATNTLEQITPATESAANFTMLTAVVSDDGSHVYFIASQRLVAGAGTFNAYVWSQAGGTRLIVAFGGGAPRVDRVSRDGRYAIFSSTASVAGAQSGGNSILYRYDAEAAELRCASCRADGAPSGAATGFGGSASRTVTDDGDVYFETADRLVPEDVNGATDAYGFDGDRPFLISAGRGAAPSTFGDVDADGRNVYFITSEQLAADDTDGDADIYTARVGGGFPVQPGNPDVRCRGDACLSPGLPAPEFLTPSSELVDGAGNLDEELPRTTIKPSLKVAKVTAAGKKRLARSGRVGISVRTSTAAKVTATASAWIGRRWVRADRVVRAFGTGGSATLQVSLSRAARHALARQGTLRVRVQVRSSRTSGSSTQTLVLRSTGNGR